ncbi:MAG TPA: DUF3095 domain-containing protein [Candidatus Obscuribacterales bacterium]
MSTENFYSELTPLDNFIDISNFENFVKAPQDWHIIITDIVNSTKAIEAGRYKEINLLGACSIASVLDIAGNIEIPFIFGGDGASLLIPPSLLSAAKQALLYTRIFAKQKFNIDLRVGIVPIDVVIKANYQVKVAKFKLFNTYHQGVFAGGGINYATDFIKDRENSHIYCLEESEFSSEKVSFSRIACPLQDIRSQHGEIVSLIVTEIVNSSEQSEQIYKEVLEQIQIIYGSEENFHPLSQENIKITFNSKKLATMLKLYYNPNNWIQENLFLLRIKIELLIGFLWLEFKIKFGKINWLDSKQDFIVATDYRKFSDTLNMVISGNTAQREKLEKFLECKYQERKLVYGLHISDRTIMTCYTADPQGFHVHFVDGADGGYALAAKAMKERMSLLKLKN